MTVNIGSAFTGSIGWRRLLRSVDGVAPLGEGLGACPPTVKDPPILPWVGVQTFDTRRGERGTGLLAYFALPGGPGRRPGPAFPRPTEDPPVAPHPGEKRALVEICTRGSTSGGFGRGSRMWAARVLDQFIQGLRPNGLREVPIHSRREAPLTPALQGVGGDRDDP